MENAKKNLKFTSIILLCLAALSAIKTIVFTLVGTEVPSVLPEGVTPSIYKIAVYIASAFALVVLLPQVYIGIKGIKYADNPDDSKAHLVWTKILLVVCIISVVSTISSIISGADILNNVLTLCSSGCDIALFFFYIKYANQVKSSLS